MRHDSLLDVIQKQDSNRTALLTPAGRYTLSELITSALEKRLALESSLRYAVVDQSSIQNFVIDLLAFDGHLQSFFLQPRSEKMESEWVGQLNEPHGIESSFSKWVIATSGTTGKPKLVEHSLKSLTATTKAYSPFRKRDVWGLLYDPARFAGLQVLLQALVGGAVLVAPDQRMSFDDAVTFMAEHGVTSLSATPSYWRRVLMSCSAEKLSLDQITLGGEIADQAVLTGLRKKFIDARIVHIYASTEIGVGFSVRDGLAGFPVEYLENGALKGVELRVDENGHLLIRRFDSQENDFLDTGDVVEVQDGRVKFLGRASGAVNVGGNKVLPEFVESVLCKHHEVLGARVYGKKSPFMGNLVVAEVMLQNPIYKEQTLSELEELCRAELVRWQRPTSIQVVESITLTGSGKLARSTS